MKMITLLHYQLMVCGIVCDSVFVYVLKLTSVHKQTRCCSLAAGGTADRATLPSYNTFLWEKSKLETSISLIFGVCLLGA